MSIEILFSSGIIIVTAVIIWWMMDKVTGRIEEGALAHPTWDKRPFFTFSRAVKLVAAFFAISCLGSIPFLVIQVWMESHEADKAVDTQQQLMDRVRKDILRKKKEKDEVRRPEPRTPTQQLEK